jgi:hypothetical protein
MLCSALRPINFQHANEVLSTNKPKFFLSVFSTSELTIKFTQQTLIHSIDNTSLNVRYKKSINYLPSWWIIS